MRAKTINEEMTAKDLELLDLAKKMDYIDWGVVSDMAKEADTEEARNELERISVRMYRKEEGFAGQL